MLLNIIHELALGMVGLFIALGGIWFTMWYEKHLTKGWGLFIQEERWAYVIAGYQEDMYRERAVAFVKTLYNHHWYKKHGL